MFEIVQKQTCFSSLKNPFEKQNNKKLKKLDRRVQNIRDYLIDKNNPIQNLNFNKKLLNYGVK